MQKLDRLQWKQPISLEKHTIVSRPNIEWKCVYSCLRFLCSSISVCVPSISLFLYSAIDFYFDCYIWRLHGRGKKYYWKLWQWEYHLGDMGHWSKPTGVWVWSKHELVVPHSWMQSESDFLWRTLCCKILAIAHCSALLKLGWHYNTSPLGALYLPGY